MNRASGDTRAQRLSAVTSAGLAGSFLRGLTNVPAGNSSFQIPVVCVAAGRFCSGRGLSGAGVSLCPGTLVC